MRRQVHRGVWAGRVRRAVVAAVVLLAAGAPGAHAAEPARARPFSLTLRARVDSPGLGGASRVVETRAEWDPSRTAVIVCDMWDLHHCLNAVRRVVEMAPRMDQFLTEARSRGAVVIHAPSDCMTFYEGHPARDRARQTPRSTHLPAGIGQWCRQIPSEEAGSYPVDQTEGGEDDDPAEHARWAARLASMGKNPRAPWTRETDKLTIDEAKDYVSDNGEEIWSVLEDRGIDNVLLMGVHLNMCVLGRPFGLRQLSKNGKNVVLMRDLTDTMYDPRTPPFVSHFTGTDRVIEHVERLVCPSATSDQVLGGAPFRFREDDRPRVAFLVAEDEYQTETTLPAFAAAYLGKQFRVSFVFDRADDKEALTGVSALEDADVLFVSARRRAFPAGQLAAVRRHVAAGKAVVGIRTASHAFALRPNVAVPAGHEVWPEFDAEVLGGHYTGHLAPGATVALRAAPGAESHPVLRGVDTGSLTGHGSLYKVRPLADSATPLLLGTVPGDEPEPVAWTNLTSAGGRVVYTSLGHRDDFANPSFARLLVNAVTYAAGREVPAAVGPPFTGSIPFPGRK